MQPQQPSKKITKPKSKAVAKKPTAQSVAAQRTAMIKKMKGDTAKPAAKKVMPKMKSGSGCVPKMAMGTSGVQPKPKPKAKATVKETPKQYAERKAVKPMNITPLGARLVDGTPKPLPSGAVSARQRAAGQQTARQRAEVDKQRANLNAGVDNLERRAAQSKANREADNFIRPSGESGVGRTNTTKGFYSRRSKSEIGTSQGGSLRCGQKAKGSSGIKTNKYPDGTKKIETKSQYTERKAMKPINLEIQKGPKPQMPDMEAATGKKMKDYIANQQHLGKMGLASLKNRQQPAKPNPNQKFGPPKERTKTVVGFSDGMMYIAKKRKGPKHSLNN